MTGNNEHDPNEEIEEYGDPGILSKDAPIPKLLIASYIFWPIFGLFWFYMFWNGSSGWLDRGYWQQLQRAAGTTIPFHKSEVAKLSELEKMREAEKN